MSLRLHPQLVEGAPNGPVLSVDGAFDAPGLNLSHWPGHRTPAALRHELSTGSALLFNRLPAAERAALTRGLTAVVNNHYDTDGTLAMFALVQPERAAALEKPLLDAAAAGDFFAYPSDEAVALDALITLLPDGERSPLRGELRGLSDLARRQRALDFALAHLVGWLSEPLDGPAWAPFLDHVRPVLRVLHGDVADLARAERHSLPERDFVHWVADRPMNPGRHALFAKGDADRVLVSAPLGSGFAHRLVVGTRSWFDLPTPRAHPRPQLDTATAALAAREPAVGPDRWRAQPQLSPSPELWFGTGELEMFAEHNGALTASALPPETVREVYLHHSA